MATVHIIGSGVAGLAAATALAEHGQPVKLYEAATSAGGRARSAQDAKLGTIDAGLHMIRAGDGQMRQMLKRIEAEQAWERLPYPYDFTDMQSGARWNIRPRKPLPRTALADAIELAHGLIARGDAYVSALAPHDSTLQNEWLAPLSRLLLGEEPTAATARALRTQLLRMVLKGAALYVPKRSLAEGLTQPALDHLEYFGGSAYFGQALKSIGRDDDRVHTLGFAKRGLPLQSDEAVILATPAKTTLKFLRMEGKPATHSAITVHYAAEHRETHGTRFITSGAFDMVRYGEKRISVMIRIADAQWSADQKHLAARLWRSLQQLHPYLEKMPAFAMMREKSAGHALGTSHAFNAALPKNCFIAGDWLDPTLPPGMEAAAMSGHDAAEAALAWLKQFPRQKKQQHFYLN